MSEQLAQAFTEYGAYGEDPLPREKTLPEIVDKWAKERPASPALVCGDARLDYAALSRRTRIYAKGFSRLGLGAGSRVLFLASNSAEWVEVAIALFRLGVRVYTLNTWAKARDISYALKSSSADMMILSPTYKTQNYLEELRSVAPEIWESADWKCSSFPSLKQLVVMQGEPPTGGHALSELYDTSTEVGDDPVMAKPDDIGFVISTSGTTREPKAVPLLHSGMVENGYGIGERMKLNSDDRVWVVAPLFWSLGSANALMAIMTHGACMVLQETFEAESAAELMLSEHCTAAYLLPAIAHALLNSPAGERIRTEGSLRTGLILGRPAEILSTIEGLNIPGLCNIYGATETYGNAVVTPHWWPVEKRIASQGPPLQGTELRIVDETGKVVPRGVVGELQVRGYVTKGYLDSPEMNEAAFTEDGWYRTSDDGYIRQEDDGFVFDVRTNEMIKPASGINISPAEIEGFLEEIDCVREVAVVGAPHPEQGEVVVAFVVPRDGFTVDEADIRARCRKALAGFKVPWAVVSIAALPQTATGKLMKRGLLDPARKVVDERLAVRA